MLAPLLVSISLTLASGACVAPSAEDPSDAPEGDVARVGEAQEALSEEADRLPRWRVLVIGEDDDGTTNGRRWRYPPSVDRAGRVVAVRAGEETDTTKRVVLELEQHW